MHSSWYSRRRREAVGSEPGSGAVMGARVASRRTLIAVIRIKQGLGHAVELRSVRFMPHVATIIECLQEDLCVSGDRIGLARATAGTPTVDEGRHSDIIFFQLFFSFNSRGSVTKVVGHQSSLSPTKVSNDFCHRPSSTYLFNNHGMPANPPSKGLTSVKDEILNRVRI